jgi:hypothetical protein
MVHYTNTIISKHKTGKLDTWTTWIKRGRSEGFCNALDQHIAATLDNFYYGETA